MICLHGLRLDGHGGTRVQGRGNRTGQPATVIEDREGDVSPGSAAARTTVVATASARVGGTAGGPSRRPGGSLRRPSEQVQ